MNSKIKLIVAGIVLSCASHGAWATTLNFDFASLMPSGVSTGYDPGHTATSNGITAAAYYYDYTASTPQWKDADLWIRNEAPNDQGLGVCSPGEPYCSPSGTSGGGDSNELSDENFQEVIVLQRPAGYSWSDLLVSSLDANGTNGGPEQGTMFWSGNDIGDLSTASSGDINTLLNNALAGSGAGFSYGTGGASSDEIDTNGNVLALNSASSFDPNAKYAVFASGNSSQISTGMLGGGTTSTTTKTCTKNSWGKWSCTYNTTSTSLNNDYLVSGGVLNAVPEPGTLALMGLGLVGIYAGRRKAVNR